MGDESRYSCQVKLPGFGAERQQKLQASSVLVVGAGGLGCPALQYLVSAGVGNVTIADDDVVSADNLHRQVLYGTEDVGRKKVQVAASKLARQNPDVHINALEERVTSDNVKELIGEHDIVIDCTDNFETRYLLNDACVLAGKPLVYGAIYQYEGQVAVWNVKNDDGSYSPNYRDLYRNVNAAQVPNCAVGGVLPTLAGIIGCMQANEAIKRITGVGEVLAGKVLVFDALSMQSRTIKMGAKTKTNITEIQITSTIPTITSEELLGNNDAYELIDVRTAEERETFHIGGRHIPLNEIEQIDALTYEKPVVLYCASGKRSREAAKVLIKKFPGVAVYSLEGGINDWSR